jgi:hypothetical protein
MRSLALQSKEHSSQLIHLLLVPLFSAACQAGDGVQAKTFDRDYIRAGLVATI